MEEKKIIHVTFCACNKKRSTIKSSPYDCVMDVESKSESNLFLKKKKNQNPTHGILRNNLIKKQKEKRNKIDGLNWTWETVRMVFVSFSWRQNKTKMVGFVSFGKLQWITSYPLLLLRLLMSIFCLYNSL